MRRRSGITLVEWMVILVMLGMVASLLVPGFVRMARQRKVEQCVSHLRALHGAQLTLESQAPATPAARGKGYWTRLTQTAPPLVTPDVLTCPLVDPRGTGECHYLGPSGDVSKMEARDPLGCDQDTNHSENGREGGNILLKSGAIINDNTLSPEALWASAVKMGKCVP
jgi:type II secretory pathway pseudopilin PulG